MAATVSLTSSQDSSTTDTNAVSDVNINRSLIPPYWSHRRYESYCSIENTKPPPIVLEDHTEEEFEQSGSVWARSVSIDDYVLVTGTVPNVGNFVVWNCKIDTLDVGLFLVGDF